MSDITVKQDRANCPLSKSDWVILCALESGYVADDDGNIFNPKGIKLTDRSAKRSGHLSISLRSPIGKCQPVLAHRFIAAFHWGINALMSECVRHLNDVPNDNRKSNLAYGTLSENRNDIPKARLSAISKANAPALVARSRKLSDADVIAMREARKNTGKPYKTLGEDFGVSTMTAYRAINYQSWSALA
jgi:hypothetical protein